jgi:hypothetical protein
MSDKAKNIVVTLIFLLVISIFLIMNLLKNDTLISETERRKLTAFPEFSVIKLFDGSFTKQFENYTMDQFIKRDEFKNLQTFINLKLLGKKDVDNLYECNGIIVKEEYPLNEKSIQNIANKINEIEEKYLDETNKAYYAIIPDKNYFADDDYLKMDYTKLENIMAENLKNIEYINIFDCLNLEDYYATDIHWKQENLEPVFEKIATQMNFKNSINLNFNKQKIVKFQGAYNLPVQTEEDYITIASNSIIENAKVYNYETNEENSIYNLDKINSLDKYDIYLSGATPLLKIENEMATTDRELIVFRDSFASSLVPLFTEAYKSITLVDTRYINPNLLAEYVEFPNKDVLFVYSTLVINNSSTLK